MRDVLIVLYLAVVVAVLFVAAVVATREEPVLADAPPDAADVTLPAGPVQPEDVTGLRFGMALRGYRMAEVDPVLARLAAEIGARDARIAELEVALVDLAEPQVAWMERAPLPPEPVREPLPDPVAEVVPAPAVDPAPDGEPEPGIVPDVTDLVAPDPAAVHLPVDSAPEADEDFPEVLLPDAAPEGLVDAHEEGLPGEDREAVVPETVQAPVAEPVFPEPVELPLHEQLPHTDPEPDWGWPGEGAAQQAPSGEAPPRP